MALLKKSPSAVSWGRAALAAAIEARAADAAKQVVAHQAVENTRAAAEIASRVVWAAQAAVDDAPRLNAQHLKAVARGDASEPPRTLREAQVDLADAENTRAAARAAHQLAEADPLLKYEPLSEERLDQAVSAVLRVEGAAAVHAVAAELERLEHELVRYGQMLRFLIGKQAFPVITEHGGRYLQPADEKIRHAHDLLDSTRPTAWLLWNQIDGAAAWRAAFEELKRDASAPLPSLTAIVGAA